jgi:hypothetical protein
VLRDAGIRRSRCGGLVHAGFRQSEGVVVEVRWRGISRGDQVLVAAMAN